MQTFKKPGSQVPHRPPSPPKKPAYDTSSCKKNSGERKQRHYCHYNTIIHGNNGSAVLYIGVVAWVWVFWIPRSGRDTGTWRYLSSLFPNCIQNDVTSQRLCLSVGLKKPRPILLVSCMPLLSVLVFSSHHCAVIYILFYPPRILFSQMDDGRS